MCSEDYTERQDALFPEGNIAVLISQYCEHRQTNTIHLHCKEVEAETESCKNCANETKTVSRQIPYEVNGETKVVVIKVNITLHELYLQSKS